VKRTEVLSRSLIGSSIGPTLLCWRALPSRGPHLVYHVLHELWSDGVCWNGAQTRGVSRIQTSQYVYRWCSTPCGWSARSQGSDSLFPAGSNDHSFKKIEFELIKIKTGFPCPVHTAMKSLLGRTKPSTGAHAARGPWVVHNRTSITQTEIISRIDFNTHFMIAYWAKYRCQGLTPSVRIDIGYIYIYIYIYTQGYHRCGTKREDGWGKVDLSPKKAIVSSCTTNVMTKRLPIYLQETFASAMYYSTSFL